MKELGFEPCETPHGTAGGPRIINYLASGHVQVRSAMVVVAYHLSVCNTAYLYLSRCL